MIGRLVGLLLALALPLCAQPRTPEAIAREILAPLLDPARVATLKGDRPINPRLYKVLFWLEKARQAGGDVSGVIDVAQVQAKYAGTVMGKADKAALTRNWRSLESFGCFTEDGMAKLRTGRTAVITKGRHAGDTIALDHILPRAVVPELAARFYNLEAIPAQVNLAKSAKIGERELEQARRWNRDGLLSEGGLKAVEARGLSSFENQVEGVPASMSR